MIFQHTYQTGAHIMTTPVPPATHLPRKISPWDTSSSVSRQHHIDTGRYLTHLETAEIRAEEQRAEAADFHTPHLVDWHEDQSNTDDDEIRVTYRDCNGHKGSAVVSWDGDGWAVKCRACGTFTDL